jgi:hypothetical protein
MYKYKYKYKYSPLRDGGAFAIPRSGEYGFEGDFAEIQQTNEIVMVNCALFNIKFRVEYNSNGKWESKSIPFMDHDKFKESNNIIKAIIVSYWDSGWREFDAFVYPPKEMVLCYKATGNTFNPRVTKVSCVDGLYCV